MIHALRHLDANLVADYSRGRYPTIRRRLEETARSHLGVSVIVIGELRLGAEKTGDPSVFQEVEAALLGVARIPVDEAAAMRYSSLRAQLESAGQKMSDNDLWIAATALVHGATLVTADEAFLRVPGLSVENWRED